MESRMLRVAIAAFCLLTAAGCSRLGGRVISVEFRNAEGLRGGEAVYLAGVRVGTAHEPKLVKGHAVVPVSIYRQHKDAVPAGTVFLLRRDPQDANRFCLAGTVCSSPSPGQKPPDTYPGARNRIEFSGVCGAAKAAELYEELTR
ncbi:MAG: MlaD family protein [Acidobacteriota bacterium]